VSALSMAEVRRRISPWAAVARRRGKLGDAAPVGADGAHGTLRRARPRPVRAGADDVASDAFAGALSG